MPLYVNYPAASHASINAIIDALGTFLQGNGWVIDFLGDYAGNRRLHVHKAGRPAHFEIWWKDGNDINMVACSGYASGSAPLSQPGAQAWSVITWDWRFADKSYWFIASGNAFYLLVQESATSGAFHIIGCYDVSSADLLGGVSSVYGCLGMYGGNPVFFGNNYPAYWSCAVDGVFSQGAYYSSVGAEGWISPRMLHNNGILPNPIIIYKSVSSNMIPICFMTNMWRIDPTGLYAFGDVITINSDSYIVLLDRNAYYVLVKLE